MVPALQNLTVHARQIGLHSEMQFYWGTGLLSGLLDNAPTYLAFLAAAAGLYGLNIEDPAQMQRFVAEHDHFLIAISMGAVFFGAATYIGNGPNFMVKSIAAHQGVKAPNFIKYILRFSLPILFPFLVLIGILFFSRWRVF
jgi:Na+/H+ antiporter NhaD/arsenite permease-like protein